MPNIESVIIGFIEGEPLLHKEKVIYIYEKTKKIAEKLNKEIYYHIDTNGTIDIQDIFASWENLSVSVTLSFENDHNKNRPANDFNSFKIITNNIKTLSCAVNHLNIRYNTNNININEFKDFVKFVHKNFPACTSLESMYTDEYPFNPEFKNSLSIKYFSRWVSSTAIDILISHNYPIKKSIAKFLKLCIAYQPFSCKIFSDGSLGLCDASKYTNTAITVADIAGVPDRLNDFFHIYKTYNPLLDIGCRGCVDVLNCMGNLFCNKKCDFSKNLHIATFLKTYVKYYKKEQSGAFLNM